MGVSSALSFKEFSGDSQGNFKRLSGVSGGFMNVILGRSYFSKFPRIEGAGRGVSCRF